MSPHYEDRLQKDLAWIEEMVRIIGATIETAIGNAVKSALQVDRELAARTVLGDYLVNRQTRELDRLSHAFVARYLPSAGHLRFISAVLRLNIALERIGDYAATISRSAVQLSKEPPPVVARDIEMMGDQARRLLREGLRAFQARDAAAAQATLNAASQFAQHFDKVFADLVREGEEHSRPITDLFSMLAAFNRLERVIHQAKNVCEETIFVATGRTKGEKQFHILFVDERNDRHSQLAEHFTRKAYPNSGRYRSCGWRAAEELDPAFVEFGRQQGLDLQKAWPTHLGSLLEQLDDYQVVVCLDDKAREQLGRIPFHTTVVTWQLGDDGSPAGAWRTLTPQIRELMELLRGEAAN